MSPGAHPPRRHEAAPGFLLQLLEIRAFWEHYAALAMRPVWGAAAKGDGHPVLVLPGLTAGDATTSLMRRFLRSRGYAASGWGQGLNLGLREGVLERAHDRLRELWIEHGRSVSLIGWSLDGLYARELAKQSPELVRLVITLGSPFSFHPRATNAWRLYEYASGHRIDSHDFHGPLRAPRPIRTPACRLRQTLRVPVTNNNDPPCDRLHCRRRAVIAFLQWKTAREKVLLDLFDKRFAVYDELRSVVVDPQPKCAEPILRAARFNPYALGFAMMQDIQRICVAASDEDARK